MKQSFQKDAEKEALRFERLLILQHFKNQGNENGTIRTRKRERHSEFYHIFSCRFR
jgi:hypothetical protein